MSSTDQALAVTASDPAGMERQLDEAVKVLRARASTEDRKGILVTRHGYGSFTVSLSEAVPYGQTREHQDW
ncbi:hypothetical protein ASG92_26820 [Arthrobacter sp. Soil736]|uniref:hypothetical protein n=1 Tax=Arthrobacter sp. Soil736 TaxID=1736395 RepID=UPI0007023C37|nr:hypothetical protein [Arthrobacter sp. Soil736]KRE48519.1 hypothetical protein ASG92_26820 [Arthrobacter sp. Soil736]